MSRGPVTGGGGAGRSAPVAGRYGGGVLVEGGAPVLRDLSIEDAAAGDPSSECATASATLRPCATALLISAKPPSSPARNSPSGHRSTLRSSAMRRRYPGPGAGVGGTVHPIG